MYIPKYSLKSAIAYSLYSVDTPVSTQALEQWQLADTRYKNRQNRGYSRSKETNSMSKEYCIGRDRYGAITLKVSRVKGYLYRE